MHPTPEACDPSRCTFVVEVFRYRLSQLVRCRGQLGAHARRLSHPMLKVVDRHRPADIQCAAEFGGKGKR